MRIVVLGSPGVGKGTYTQALVEKTGILHISTGDLFRHHIREATELGKQVQQYLDAGKLVPDTLTIALIKERLCEDDCSQGFVLDGFPRTIAQAEALEQFTPIDLVLSFSADREVIISRLTGRMICRDCSRIYHKKNMLPKEHGICDLCNGEIYEREDDQPGAIRQRLELYEKETAPLIEYYTQKGLLKNLLINEDFGTHGQEIMGKILAVLDEVAQSRGVALQSAQRTVMKFNEEREWFSRQTDIKDLLLNIMEECGEAWNLIKWVDLEKQRELVKEQHDQWEDFIGDQLYLLLKIAALTGVDAEKAFDRTMKDYEKRFPVTKVKGTHTNLHAGGYDGKYVG